ncbi:MAG: DUF4887 domain-containing protein, partial [Candidatus Viridilinea halotolerans]
MKFRLIHAFALILFTLLMLVGGAFGAQPGFVLQAADGHVRQFLARFYALEQHEQAAYRWSAGEAAIFLYGFEGQPALVRLRLAGPREPGAPGALVTLSTQQQTLAQLQTSEHWRDFALLVPTQATGETALVLRSDPFRAPGDPRELGVALQSVGAVALGNMPLQPIRALYLLMLPLLAWLLLVRLGVAPRWALGMGLLVAVLMGLAAAQPTAAGYWLPTLAWPWWPGLPLALLSIWPQLSAGQQRVATWRRSHPWLGMFSLAVAFGALLLMRLGLSPALGLSLLIGGVWFFLMAPAKAHWHAVDSAHHSSLATRHYYLALLLIFALALGLRLVNLDGQPAGLWRDEARHGLQALQIWHDRTYRPIYVVEGADLPALLFYLMAPVVGLLGAEIWSVRLVSAVAGALTPLALAWAAAPILGRRGALTAAALLAWASWSLSMSRWAFPATLDHLLTLTAVGVVWRVGRRTEEQKNRRTEEQGNRGTEEQKNRRTEEQGNRGTEEQQNSRTAEQQNSRTAEQQNSRTAEQQNSRTAEQQNSRTAEQQNSRTAEQQNSRTAEQQNSRTAE